MFKKSTLIIFLAMHIFLLKASQDAATTMVITRPMMSMAKQVKTPQQPAVQAPAVTVNNSPFVQTAKPVLSPGIQAPVPAPVKQKLIPANFATPSQDPKVYDAIVIKIINKLQSSAVLDALSQITKIGANAFISEVKNIAANLYPEEKNTLRPIATLIADYIEKIQSNPDMELGLRSLEKKIIGFLDAIRPFQQAYERVASNQQIVTSGNALKKAIGTNYKEFFKGIKGILLNALSYTVNYPKAGTYTPTIKIAAPSK